MGTRIATIILMFFLLLLTGCASANGGAGLGAVEPWEKGNLAKRHMKFDPDPTEARYVRKVYAAKEGTSGGFGIGGGGCGCN
jgi:hypothetical protein